MNNVAKPRERRAEWGEGFTDHRMIAQRQRSRSGKEPSLSRVREALANQETQHLLGKYELVLKRAAIEHSLNSNLVLSTQRRSSKKAEAIHFYSVAQVLSCCLLPHFLVTNNEGKICIDGSI